MHGVCYLQCIQTFKFKISVIQYQYTFLSNGTVLNDTNKFIFIRQTIYLFSHSRRGSLLAPAWEWKIDILLWLFILKIFVLGPSPTKKNWFSLLAFYFHLIWLISLFLQLLLAIILIISFQIYLELEVLVY